ncbi:MAG: acyl carrier protein [Clostridia bacterium]|jgi:acyl carrier protein|nr:acyl carrier protein [Clostridia bacterium]MBT7122441.1 acyl carrier protein [Clostridia bacterium]
MTREKVTGEVQNIFRDLFDDESIVIDDNTTADDVEDWDSLEHINLITSIEKHFSIKFAMSEVTHFKNVGNMIDTITTKVS